LQISGVPESRIRLLHHLEMHRHVVVLKPLAMVRDASGAQTLPQHRQHFVICVACLVKVAAEPFMLHITHAAPHPWHEATMGKLVDHAEFLDQPRGMIQRQTQHHGPQADPRSATRHGCEKHYRRWRHVERREVMFRDVISVKPMLLGPLDQPNAFIVLLPQRDIGTLLEMIPPTELHGHDVLLQTALPARAAMVSVVRRSSPAYSNSAPCILASAWAEASAAPVCLLNVMGKLRFGHSVWISPPDQGWPTKVA
jgi:hypothetical protein